MTTLSQLSKDLIGVLLLVLFGYCLFFVDINTHDLAIPASLLNVNSIFLSIVLEAIPFILIGVFASALIQVFVSEEFIQRLIPKNPYIALLPAVLVSFDLHFLYYNTLEDNDVSLSLHSLHRLFPTESVDDKSKLGTYYF